MLPARFPATQVALGVVLLLALTLRLWGLGAQSLWHDEVLTTLSASVPFTKVIDAVESNENKPPLYFIVMNLWVRAAGLSEVALRLPSVIFGVAAVAVIYLLGRELFDERVGLLAALLLAFSRYHIAYSQEARTYSLFFLLMLLACWFMVRMIARDSVRDQIGYVISAALAMYAHPFAAFALAAMNLFYCVTLLFGPKPATNLRRWLILQAAIAIAFWPWLSKTWLVVKTGLPWIIESISFPTAMLSYAGSVALFGLLLVLVAVALGYGLARRERGVLLLVLLVILPILGPLAFASRLYQTFIPRYGIVVVGALLLLAAYGAARLRPWAAVLVCIAYVTISLTHFRPGHGNYPGAEAKADIRGAARHIVANAQVGDAVWNPSEVLFARPINHYLGRTGLTLLAEGDTPDPQRFPRLWVFYDHLPHEGDPFPAGYSAFKMKTLDGVVLYELAARPEPPAARDVREDSTRPSDSATVSPPRYSGFRSDRPMAKPANKPIQSVAFVSLGCPKNLVDSERMLGLLAEDGLAITPDAESADAIVINTCGFLEASKDESLKEINDAIALKKAGRCKRVVVAGCLVQRHKTKLLNDAPGIDRLVGVFDREHIVEAVRGRENPRQEHGHFLGKYHDLSRELAEAQGLSPGCLEQKQTKTNRLPVFENDRARFRLTPRHYAFLRMSEGCNQGCTFCTIPSIRGLMRSKPIEQILLEAEELAADGAVELNLIGQDTTSYGTDIGYAPGLSGLLKTLDKRLKDVHWLRLMYAYPSCFSDEMIKTIADSGRVVKYIDMPLQHINDQILTNMRRRVTRKEIETLLNKLRKWVPGIAIRTTFIAGTPGETEAQHRELVEFVRDFGFDMMGVFPYSREPGTPMARMDGQVDEKVKQARVEELMLAQQEVAFAKAKSMAGSTIEVLVDRPAGRDAEDGSAALTAGGYVARSRSQAPDIDSCVFVNGNGAALHPGQLVNVRVTDYQNYDLVAEVPRKRSRSLNVVSR